MSGWARDAHCEKHPGRLVPRAAREPPKLGGARSAARSLEERRPWPALPSSPPWARHSLVSGPQGPLRAFSEAGECRPRSKPQAPKFPRNSTIPLGGGHPGCPQTRNPGHKGLPTRRGPGEYAASAPARHSARGPAQWPKERGSPEPVSLQWDQSGKRDLPGQKGRRAENQLSPLESQINNRPKEKAEALRQGPGLRALAR